LRKLHLISELVRVVGLDCETLLLFYHLLCNWKTFLLLSKLYERERGPPDPPLVGTRVLLLPPMAVARLLLLLQRAVARLLLLQRAVARLLLRAVSLPSSQYTPLRI